MSIGLVHLSDIHFGQEKGGMKSVHNDVKNCLIDDVRLVAKDFEAGQADGIIVTGDIAFSGCESEYVQAADWLDRIAKAAGCEIFDIQVVPGNHDIDRKEITALTEIMLEQIATNGESALDSFLEHDADRDLLFRRFSSYRPFAEGYRCPLDTNAELAEERIAALTPERSIRFIRLNSALVCSKKNDMMGKLLLGARQRVLNKRPGEELVVLCHHPLHWFQDSKDALLFIRNRARVFISGHEHYPKVNIEKIDSDRDLMMLAAGATVPPASSEELKYCYNLIEFDWDTKADALSVRVRPRAWVNDKKQFADDYVQLGGRGPRFTLACPKHSNSLQTKHLPTQEAVVSGASETVRINVLNDHGAKAQEAAVADTYPLLLLRFFRDISTAQRVRILAVLGAIPPDWKGTLNESTERRAFDALVKAGRSDEIWTELNKIAQK